MTEAHGEERTPETGDLGSENEPTKHGTDDTYTQEAKKDTTIFQCSVRAAKAGDREKESVCVVLTVRRKSLFL